MLQEWDWHCNSGRDGDAFKTATTGCEVRDLVFSTTEVVRSIRTDKGWVDDGGRVGPNDDAGDRREPCLRGDVLVDLEGPIRCHGHKSLQLS